MKKDVADGGLAIKNGDGMAPLSAIGDGCPRIRGWGRALWRAISQLWLALAVLGFAAATSAADHSAILAEAIQLKEQYRDAEALAVLERLLDLSPNDAGVLLHAAHLHFRLGWLHGEGEERRRRFFAANQAAQKALALAPADVAIRLMAVVTKGKIAGYLSSGEQVRIAREVYQEVEDLAKLLGPDHVDLLHVRSWLHFKVGKTSSVERVFAKLLFGGLPEDLSVATAVTLMRRAMELRPESLIYPYDLGIFYQRLGQEEEARPWFEKVLAMAPATPEDKVYQGWARKRLARIAGREG